MDNQENIINLILGCKKKDRVSQKKLYQQFYGYGMSVCIRYSSDKDEAQEILNDGFMKVFTKIDMYSESKPFKGWLRRILINTALDYYRKNLKYQYNTDVEEAVVVETDGNAFDKMSYEDLLGLVQRLTPMYRTVFSLYVIDGYNHEEIAKKIGISVGTSKSNLSKARANLKKMLQNSDEEIYAKYS